MLFSKASLTLIRDMFQSNFFVLQREYFNIRICTYTLQEDGYSIFVQVEAIIIER